MKYLVLQCCFALVIPFFCEGYDYSEYLTFYTQLITQRMQEALNYTSPTDASAHRADESVLYGK